MKTMTNEKYLIMVINAINCMCVCVCASDMRWKSHWVSVTQRAVVTSELVAIVCLLFSLLFCYTFIHQMTAIVLAYDSEGRTMVAFKDPETHSWTDIHTQLQFNKRRFEMHVAYLKFIDMSESWIRGKNQTISYLKL